MPDAMPNGIEDLCDILPLRDPLKSHASAFLVLNTDLLQSKIYALDPVDRKIWTGRKNCKKQKMPLVLASYMYLLFE
jgi:hypothetical protein